MDNALYRLIESVIKMLITDNPPFSTNVFVSAALFGPNWISCNVKAMDIKSSHVADAASTSLEKTFLQTNLWLFERPSNK